MGLHFTKEEFSNRKSKIIRSMKEQNIDALLMFRQESMYWLTGYDTFGYVFFQTLVLDQKGNIILLTRAPDLRQHQNTSNINDKAVKACSPPDNNVIDCNLLPGGLTNISRPASKGSSYSTNSSFAVPPLKSFV